MIAPSEVSRLVHAWIKLQLSEHNSPAHQANMWAHGAMWHLNRDAPQECWEVILAILAADNSDWLLANLGTGPVEDILALHGPQFIEAVEKQARQNPDFRRMLGNVWRNEMPEEIWHRVLAAQGRSE